MMKITFVRKYQEKIIFVGIMCTLNCKVGGVPVGVVGGLEMELTVSALL